MKISIIEILVNLFSCALGSAIELLLVSLKEFLLYDGSIGKFDNSNCHKTQDCHTLKKSGLYSS